MRRSILVLAPLLALAAPDARAQEQLLAGPAAGYEFSVPLLLRRAEGAINYEPTFAGTGRSWSHSLGLGAQIVVPAALGALGYSARIALVATNGSFRSDPFVPGLDLSDTSLSTELPPERFRRIDVDMTAATIVADAQIRYSIARSLIAGAGLWTSYRLSGQFMRRERPEIVPPDIDPEDATIITGGDVIAAHEVGYGGLVTLGALVPLSSRITLMPEIATRLDAVALRLGMGFKSFTIGAGVSVLFDPSPDPVAIAPVGAIDLAARDSASTASARDGAGSTTRPSRLEARVDLFAEGSSERSLAALVEPQEVVNRMVIALPRIVPYQNGAFDIPGGFARITPGETAGFSARSLAGLDVAGHWRHYLNILGSRLRESKGSIEITGIGASTEPAGLARVRAEVLRDYLVEVWGISSQRIALRSTRGAAAAVRLDGTDELFATPLLSQWRTRRYRMPQLGLERFIVADAGVRRWTLALAQAGRTLARFDSDTSEGEPALDVRFIAGGDSAAPIAPIVATLTVEDSLGRTTIATDELPIARAVATPSAETRGERLELVAFDAALDSIEAHAERRRAALRAARMLRDGAVVTVGFVGLGAESARGSRTLELGRVAEELLAAANERGVRIERFVAERDSGDASTPGGIRILVEQQAAPVASE